MPAPKLSAFPEIEISLADKLKKAWTPIAADIEKRIVEACEAGDEAAAVAVLNDLTAEKMVEKLNGYIKLQLSNALLLGSSWVDGLETSIYVKDKKLPPIFYSAKKQFENMIVVNMIEQVRKTASKVIANYFDLKSQAAVLKQELADATLVMFNDARALRLKKADDEMSKLASALNAAVDGNGKGLIDVGANLTTSRLVSYGFLSQASAVGETTYQITEVLDEKICPFCEMMHGKKFEVDPAMTKMETILQEEDPEALKALAPWPKITKENMKTYKGMSNDTLKNNGWDVPPYHPLCRGTLVVAGSVAGLDEPDEPTEDFELPVYDKPDPGTVVQPNVTGLSDAGDKIKNLLSPELKDQIEQGKLNGLMGGPEAQKQYLTTTLNIDPDDYDKAMELIQGHTRDATQVLADGEILQHIEADDAIGKALKKLSDFEDQVYRTYEDSAPARIARDMETSKNNMKKAWTNGWGKASTYDNWEEQWASEEEYKFVYKKQLFYRKGDADKGIISTTRNSKGAKSGAAYFKPDHKWTYDELYEMGYRLISGYSWQPGYFSEAEVIWAKLH
jgi:hypothetical protein